MMSFLQTQGFDPWSQLKSTENKEVFSFPFVYIFGRSDFTVSYFGANIYPENVIVGLEQPSIRDWVTGKFVMEVKQNEDNNAYLAITVELAQGITASEAMKEAIAFSIYTQLIRLNSEFANYVPAENHLPQVSLLPFGNPDYFPLGVKHRYTRKGNGNN